MPVGKPPLHQLVMDVLSIGGKERLAVQEAAGDGDYRIQDRQSEGYDGNTDRNQGRGLAPTHQSQSAQRKANEQTSRVPEKDTGRIEIVLKKSERGPGQGYG